ncbi:MAG: S8 family serine peptidase [Candidatus Omnitrophota bacterium]
MKTNRTLKIFAILVVFGLFYATNLYAEVKIAVIDSGTTDNFYERISFSSIPANRDPTSHGTKIARIIRNSNPSAKIYMLQVCEKSNLGYKPSARSVLKAIKWCEENDIDIVNLSLVLNYNKEIEAAIKQAYYNKGIIFIAAAGNNSLLSRFAANQDGYMCLSKTEKGSLFPASFDYVISVGAKASNGKTADYSPSEVDVSSEGDYGKEHGTSFACARVTGEASKILTLNSNISLEELKLSLK